MTVRAYWAWINSVVSIVQDHMSLHGNCLGFFNYAVWIMIQQTEKLIDLYRFKRIHIRNHL